MRCGTWPALTMAAGLLLSGPVRRASACKPTLPAEHVVDAAGAASDKQAPSLVSVRNEVTPERDPEIGCGGTVSGDSCDDLGWVVLFPQASDDVTPADQLGYRVTATGPTGLHIPGTPVQARDGKISLLWSSAGTVRRPLSLVLAVTALDRAGNESAPLMVSVRERDSGACRYAAGARPSPVLIAAALAFVLLALRRRQRGGGLRDSLRCSDRR